MGLHNTIRPYRMAEPILTGRTLWEQQRDVTTLQGSHHTSLNGQAPTRDQGVQQHVLLCASANVAC